MMTAAEQEKVLVLTPAKDAERHVEKYVANLNRLSYRRDRLSVGILESDSVDRTFERLQDAMVELRTMFASAQLWKKDFGYRIPENLPRWSPSIQLMRRSILARSRNHLLFRALDDEAWILWLDIDVIEYPPDIIDRLLSTRKRIVQPNCVIESRGPSFDRNAWRGADKAVLSDLRYEGDLVELDSVGGTMLLVRADLHRDGLIFPAFPYGQYVHRVPIGTLTLETEGLALMARDMGYRAWGMPNLEIRHVPD
jgi:Anp1 protein